MGRTRVPVEQLSGAFDSIVGCEISGAAQSVHDGAPAAFAAN
jgi:hypothetical protein